MRNNEHDQEVLVKAIARGYECDETEAWMIAEEIYERYSCGESSAEDLLEEYNVSHHLVSNLVNFL